ncbi:helix-turn-helix domain-containing protein [Streptomyces sp. NPDC056704]|uniref:helix-turn-helix domain-containing protein n=1 Tax=Streptomyces sp. NPDC056704 TaxID=3345917 RepID=UPI0036C25527
MSDTCEFCGSALAEGPGKGRPRKYCGDACRQAAHRRRLHDDTATPFAAPHPAQAGNPTEPRPAPRTSPAPPTGAHSPSAGDELLIEIAKDIQDGARDLARLLPSFDGEEPLQRIAQLHEQLDGLTAAVVGRARYRRVTWATVSSILRVSEDTARHRYTERYILRRLTRFNRSEAALTSLTGLFSSTTTRLAESPDEPAADGGTAGGSCDSGGERGEGPEQSAPIEPSGAAYNRLSPILSMLVRTAQLTNKEVSSRIGCSASYLSRILSGERVPTWDLTRKFAHTCGADPEVLRTVWESEKLSQKSRELVMDLDDTSLTAAEQLRVAVQTLHLRAGRPAPNDVAVASRWMLSASAVASILEATLLPPSPVLESFVRILGGDVDHFSRLLDNARTEAAHKSARLQPSPHPTPHPSPAVALAEQTCARQPDTDPRNAPPVGADVVMKTFSKVLTEDRTVEDGRARLLHKFAKQHVTPVRQKDGARPRPLTAIAEALRHRTLAPTPAISPLQAGS